MKRRALLGTLATTAFAGCAGVLGDSAGPNDSPTTNDPTNTDDSTDTPTTDDPTNSPTSTGPMTDPESFEYAIADVQTDDPPAADVTVGVTVEQEFTAEHPAALRVAFTNDADDARTFQFGSLVPWDALRGTNEDGTGSLLLAPGTNVVPDEPDGDCWRATDSLALPMVMKSGTLDPGETVSQTFRVLAAYDSEVCLQSGTYRFEDEGYLGEGWGFSVDVVPVVE